MSITLKKVFAVYVFALSFLFASRPISDPDLWFHLAAGKFIVLNMVFLISTPSPAQTLGKRMSLMVG